MRVLVAGGAGFIGSHYGRWEHAGLEPIRDWRAALRAALPDGLS
jgi:hypothetical protein